MTQISLSLILVAFLAVGASGHSEAAQISDDLYPLPWLVVLDQKPNPSRAGTLIFTYSDAPLQNLGCSSDYTGAAQLSTLPTQSYRLCGLVASTDYLAAGWFPSKIGSERIDDNSKDGWSLTHLASPLVREAEKHENDTGGLAPPEVPPTPSLSAPSQYLRNLGSFALTIETALLALLGLILGAFVQRRFNTRSNRAIEREIGAILGDKDFTLSNVPDKLREAESNLRTEHHRSRSLIDKLLADQSSLKEALAGSPKEPHEIRCAAILGYVVDALAGVNAAHDDADFEAVNAALCIDEDLSRLGASLQRLSKNKLEDFGPILLEELENGRFDGALSITSFLDAYFAERAAWRPLRTAFRAIEALLISLIEAYGIRLILSPVLSIVPEQDLRDVQSTDRRNVRSIPIVRQTAARLARNLDSSEYLVVDSQAPGWFSKGPLGLKHPRFAVYEISTWT